MNRLCSSFALLLFMASGVFSQASEQSAAKPRPFANGVYAVLAEAPSSHDVKTDKVPHAVLVYDGKYSAADQKEPPSFVALDLSSFVPLILAHNPDLHTDERGHAALDVTLAQEHVKPLEDFTRAHLGRKIAIVIDGEIVTMHKVRSVIQDGKAQITRCTDNACQRLYVQLTR